MDIVKKKNEISRKYLGVDGVHGVGVSRSRGVIKLHVARPHSEKQRREFEHTLERAKQDAAPYEVQAEVEEKATIQR